MTRQAIAAAATTGGMQVPVRRGDFQAAERRLP
jgi:hypothetical protein